MDFYYKINDWEKIAAADPNYITVKGHKVPYAVFENEPEKTLDPALNRKRVGKSYDEAVGDEKVRN